MPEWPIDAKDKDLLAEKKEVELEVKESNLDLVGKCGQCYSSVSDHRRELSIDYLKGF